MTDPYGMGRPVVVNAPRDIPGIVAPPLPGTAIVVPVAGRDGTSISIGGTVATYAELPALEAGDRGTLYVVEADGLGYVWSGSSWPADGAGIEIRGEKGDRGLGIAAIAVAGDTLELLMTDGSIETVAVPVLEAAAQSALAAAGSAMAADGHRQEAADSAQAAADDAALIEATVPYIVQYREDALTAAVEAGESELAADGSATLAAQHRQAAEGHATAAAGSAGDAHDDQVLAAQHKADADTARQAARDAADGFGLTSTATTGAPGSIAVATVVRDGAGPTYTLHLQIPRGDKGEQGEISQQELENAITAVHLAILGVEPETLRTIGALSEALGDDPNFSVTIMGMLAGKAPLVHAHTGAQVTATVDMGDGPMQMTLDAIATNLLSLGAAHGELSGLVRARPALFSGPGAPPASIPEAVIGDWWLDISSMELYKITGGV